MILRIKIIRYLCRLNFASWIPQLRTYGSELGWYVGFKLGFSVDMVPGAHVVSPLGYSINMLLVLAIENSFGTWEGYLVGDSLGLPFISPLDSPNHLADLPGTLLVTPLGLWFGSDVVGGGGNFIRPSLWSFYHIYNECSKVFPTDGVANLIYFSHLVDPYFWR